ncbi:hypothetical protein WA158_001818 [Blastocystis sp. Blastoise]
MLPLMSSLFSDNRKVGFTRTIHFFNPFERSNKWKGVLCFFGGVLLVLFRWPITGMIVEAYGMIYLFGRFFPMIVSFLSHLPYVGAILDQIPYINTFIHKKAEDMPRMMEV